MRRFLYGRDNILSDNLNKIFDGLLQEQEHFKCVWIVCGDKPLDMFIHAIKQRGNYKKYKISNHFIYEALKELTLKIDHVVQPIINVETSYLKRKGYLTSDRSKCREDLFYKINGCIKKKYKLLDTILDNIVGGFIGGLFLMLDRLEQDFDMLSRLIKNTELAVLDSVEWLGDPHFHGGAVMSVTLNEVKIIYKPRSLSCEENFNKIARDFGGCFYNVIDCKDYGWAEYVNSNGNQMDYNDIFYNAGRLQGLAYILMLKDLHSENIKLLNYGYYVLDAECIFSTPVDFNMPGFYESNNILDYLIIPVTVNSGEVSLRSISSLASYIDKEKLTKKKTIVLINKFLDGFCFSYKLAIKNKEKIVRSVNEYFDEVNVRCVLRSTSYYRKIIELFLHPRTIMMDKDNVSALLLEYLKRGGVPSDIMKSEVKSILNGDIPYFYHNNKDGGVSDIYGSTFKYSGQNYKKQVIISFLRNGINSTDMQKQISLIKLFLDCEIQNCLCKEAEL